MKRLAILVALALLGIAIAAWAVWEDSVSVTGDTVGLPRVAPPFADYVAGSGLVEAATRTIPVGTYISGVVTNVFVKPGDRVSAGDPLFSIDDRDINARLAVAQANVEVARAAYQRSKHHLQRAVRLKKSDANAITREAFIDRRDDVAEKKAALLRAQAEVARLAIDQQRCTVRALISGVILKVAMLPGQDVEAGNTTPPLMLMGGAPGLRLRVNINEQDAWQIHPGAPAVAYVRGHPKFNVKLAYDHIEPYVLPKTALTGLSTERTDTRVLQVVYRIKPATIPLYVGEQLDAFIRTSKVSPK